MSENESTDSAEIQAESDDVQTVEDRPLGASYFKLFGASTISNLGDGIALVAYPWLASAVTRNGILIALVVVVQRLPWLFFSLPAGVITDRYDRRSLMIWANRVRAVITLGVAGVVLTRQGSLLGPDELVDATTANFDAILYGVVLLATFLLGTAEVLYDNTAQTFLPSVVHSSKLEKANGRLWSAEMVANTFAGPPLGALLLVIAFSAPFFVDAATFALSAVLISLIPKSSKDQPTSLPVGDTEETADEDREAAKASWKGELREGFDWLWRHELLRPMAIILGMLNMLGTLSTASVVLFAQEILDTSPTEFAVLETGAAVAGVIAGWTAGSIIKRTGTGPAMAFTMLGGGITTIIVGLSSWWPIVWLMFGLYMFGGVLWNVITVSLRQTIIPDHLLGRVNSVYRFFAWGMMPIGALLGGIIIAVAEQFGSREFALRLPWFVAGVGLIVLFVFAAPKLTTEKLEKARNEALD